MDDGREVLAKSLKAGKVELLTLDGLNRDSGLQPSDLEGHAVCIDYKDSEGDLSRRWISIHHVDTDADAPLIVGYCWKRRMSRTFRVDRISSVMDMDGEVLPAKEFFAAFGIAPAKKRQRKSTTLPVPEPASATVASAPTGGKYASQKPRKRKASDQLPDVGKPPPDVHDEPERKWVNHFPGPEWDKPTGSFAKLTAAEDALKPKAETQGKKPPTKQDVVGGLILWAIIGAAVLYWML
ncbi:MAG: hypothetical protein H7Y60_09780 [Rhodospirillaceae bacterium]|nr:hypothetical protein [Rhodospirillales bacterium]